MFDDNFSVFNLNKFKIKTLTVQSDSLKGNPLNDPFIRKNPCLVPSEKGEYKCVLYLSGFTSNGNKNFNFKPFQKNFIEELDDWTKEGSIKPHIYVFVDAWTTWGGSQFINSKGCGNYEDYIVKDLVPQIKESLSAESYEISDFALLGGSSGGYGALHLSSKYPETFPHSLAIAPDSDFELSLKPELYTALYDVENLGGVSKVLNKLQNYEMDSSKRSFHTVVNALAMAACYSEVDKEGVPVLPVNNSGELNEKLWGEWLKKDPIHFLKERRTNLEKLKTVFLSVGEFDQFLLQYGARKIKKILEDGDVQVTYEEFRGNHFDIGERRKKALGLL